MAAAEAVFKPAPKAAPAREPTTASVPGARQLVSLRLDEEVLDHFQADGPGWQERINAALRRAIEP